MDDRKITKATKDINGLIDNFLTQTLSATSSIARYNIRKFIIRQSVAEHEGNVTMIAMVISDYLNAIGVKNDTELALRIAITHDNDEIVTGDIPYRAKYTYGERSEKVRKAVSELNKITIDYIYGMIPFEELRKRYKEEYEIHEGRKRIESKIVKLADWADVIIYTDNEVKLGNKSLMPIKVDARRKFNGLLKEVLADK